MRNSSIIEWGSEINAIIDACPVGTFRRMDQNSWINLYMRQERPPFAVFKAATNLYNTGRISREILLKVLDVCHGWGVEAA